MLYDLNCDVTTGSQKPIGCNASHHLSEQPQWAPVTLGPELSEPSLISIGSFIMKLI